MSLGNFYCKLNEQNSYFGGHYSYLKTDKDTEKKQMTHFETSF